MKIMGRLFGGQLPFMFSFPALLWQGIFLYTPLCMLLVHSFFDIDPVTLTYVFTLKHYVHIFKSLYIGIVMRSLWLAIVTVFFCFLIAYPVAYYLAIRGAARYRAFLLFSLILPSWTSLIVQIYAWFFLLEKNGFLSRLLTKIGIISSSTHLLNNFFSILIGMVCCYVPFMILPIYAVLEKMDKRYLEVSADLGANRFQTFCRVVLPLSLPGVYAGLLLVFIPSWGEFAIPMFLGGSKYMFWGNLIVEKFLISAEWGTGGALVMVGVIFIVLLITSCYAIGRFIHYWRERKSKLQYQGASYKELWT